MSKQLSEITETKVLEETCSQEFEENINAHLKEGFQILWNPHITTTKDIEWTDTTFFYVCLWK